ncbi:MAG: GspE/PulE/PilB domain-containing protein [Gaiellaceae bacterium]
MIDDAVTDNSGQTGLRTALGTLLIERGFLDADRLDEALRIGAESGERLGEVVIRLGWATEEDLAKTLAEQWHLRYLERSAISFDGDALRRMSHEDATRLEALPMQVNQDGALVVALAEPTDARLMTLRSLLGDRIDCVVVPKTAIDAGLRSGLLAKSGVASVEADSDAVADADADEPTAEAGEQDEDNEEPKEREPVLSLVTPGLFESSETESADEPKTANFDEVATSLTEALNSQLAPLRTVVVEAQAMHDRDRREIAQLQDELSARDDTIRARNETIRSMEQKLREFADTLVDAHQD